MQARPNDEAAGSPPGVHTWLVLMKAFRAIAARGRRGLGTSGLCDSDFRILEILLHKGALPVNTLGPRVNLTAGSISTAVDRLHRRGLVSRVEDPGDRRVRRVDLTPGGRALIEPIFRRHAAEMDRVFSVLTASERMRLESLLKKVGRSTGESVG